MAVAVAGASGGALWRLRSSDDGPNPAVASSYRVVYRVEDLTGAAPRVQTETVEVVRPFRSRRRLAAGPPPGGTALGGNSTTEHGVYTIRDDGRAQQVAVAAPGEAGNDLRLVTSLAAAERRGLARRDGSGEQAGRPCTWWVTREPLDTADAAVASAADATRSCVSPAGLLLADSWRLGGREVRRRTAVTVAEQATLAGLAAFGTATPEPLPATLVTTVVQRQSVTSDGPQPGGLPQVAAALVTELTPLATPPSPERRTTRRVYADGNDIVVEDRVRFFVGTAQPRAGSPVSLGGELGTGQLRATPGGLVVEAVLPDGQLLRVRSSLPESVLVDWLRDVTARA